MNILFVVFIIFNCYFFQIEFVKNEILRVAIKSGKIIFGKLKR